MKQQQKTNGVAKLDEQMEAMRLQVVQLELRARYWKAQYEIKEFMLRDKELKADYETYMGEIMAEEQQKLEDLKKHVAENEDKGLAIEPVLEEQLDEAQQQAQ